jgi:hypothetical protein
MDPEGRATDERFFAIRHLRGVLASANHDEGPKKRTFHLVHTLCHLLNRNFTHGQVRPIALLGQTYQEPLGYCLLTSFHLRKERSEPQFYNKIVTFTYHP